MFFVAVIGYKLAVGVTVAAAYRYVWVQLGVLGLSEVAYMLLIAAFKPHARMLRNGFELGLSVLRLVNLGLLCATVSSLNMSDNVRQGMETASIVLQLLVVVSMALVMLGGLITKAVCWFRVPSAHPPSDQDGKSDTKDGKSIETTTDKKMLVYAGVSETKMVSRPELAAIKSSAVLV